MLRKDRRCSFASEEWLSSCYSLGMAPWPGLYPLGYMWLGIGGRCLQTKGLAILSPGGSDEDSSSPGSSVVVCKEKEPSSLVVQAWKAEAERIQVQGLLDQPS